MYSSLAGMNVQLAQNFQDGFTASCSFGKVLVVIEVYMCLISAVTQFPVILGDLTGLSSRSENKCLLKPNFAAVTGERGKTGKDRSVTVDDAILFPIYLIMKNSEGAYFQQFIVKCP